MARAFISILLFMALPSFGQSPDEGMAAFEAGNEAYADGNFEEAIDHYEKATEWGKSAALHFNLGNAYFKTNQVGRAILHYERSLLLDPNDADVQYNLKLANDRIKDKIEKLPELNITRWWKEFTLAISVNAWAWITVALMALAMIGLLLYFISGIRALRIIGFYTALLLLVGCAFSYYQTTHAQELTEAETEAIILSPRVDVKGAPTDSGMNVFVIHEGTKVQVLRQQEGWINIRIASGNEGWIPESDLVVI